MDKIDIFLNDLSQEELLTCYNKLLNTFKDKYSIRTKNIIGEIGEYLAINYYSKSKDFPNLVITKTNTSFVDALSETDSGIKYAIKATSSNATGIFLGMDKDAKHKHFDYLVLVCFTKDYQLRKIYQLSWEQFLDLRQWANHQNGYRITLTKKLYTIALQVF